MVSGENVYPEKKPYPVPEVRFLQAKTYPKNSTYFLLNILKYYFTALI